MKPGIKISIALALGILLSQASFTTTPSVVGQSPRSAIEYQSLLNLRYYEADGGFLVENLQLVFPQGGNQKLTFVVSKAGGEVVARVPLRTQSLHPFEAFRLLQPDGVPGGVRVGQSGDFLMSVMLGDQSITTLPFSLKEEKNADPFNPKKRYVREGPWREFAYFSSRLESPDTPIKFNWWMSLRELPPGAQRARCTIHVTLGGQEIAASRSPVVLSYDDWQYFNTEMVQSTGPKRGTPQWLTLPALTKKDGDLSVTIKVNGQPFKHYRGQVRGARIEGLSRSQMEFEPHTEFIAPRLIDTSEGSSSKYRMLDLFWLKTNTR